MRTASNVASKMVAKMQKTGSHVCRRTRILGSVMPTVKAIGAANGCTTIHRQTLIEHQRLAANEPEGMMLRKDVAIVIKVGERFYVGPSKSGRLQTAWSLAGATLFCEWNEKPMLKAEAEVAKRGKKCERVFVETRNA